MPGVLPITPSDISQYILEPTQVFQLTQLHIAKIKITGTKRLFSIHTEYKIIHGSQPATYAEPSALPAVNQCNVISYR